MKGGREIRYYVPVVCQQDTRVGINIGPGVLGLASLVGERWLEFIMKCEVMASSMYLEQDVRNKLVDLANQLEEGVFREVLEGEFALSNITGVLYKQENNRVRKRIY